MQTEIYTVKQLKKDLIDFLKSNGIEVHTNTKARGNNGFYRKGRIDISYLNTDEKAISVLVHEFAHYIHSKIEIDIAKNHGNLSALFPNFDENVIKDELIKVTLFIEKNSSLKVLKEEQINLKKEIKRIDCDIKQVYPNFKRSEKFNIFDKFLKKSELKYFLKYDRFKYKKHFFSSSKIYDLQNLKFDFPDVDENIERYLHLKSLQRKQKRISSRLYRYEKYYNRPSELFARFVECFFLNNETVYSLAPYTSDKFLMLLKNGFYFELKNMFDNFFLTNKMSILKDK